jgi:3-oxoadipate enol-lactonase
MARQPARRHPQQPPSHRCFLIVPYARNGSVRIFWDEHGRGDPALLCMGFAYTAAMWHRAIPALSTHHRVLTFDNRGVGHSDVPRGGYRIEDMAADGIAVLDAAGVDRAHVYGVSMGGLIAQEIALAYPSRVRSLVLGCTGCTDPADEKAPGWRKALIRFMPTGPMVGRHPERQFGPGVSQDIIEEDRLTVRSSRPRSRGATGQALAIGSYGSRYRLPSLTVPTLVIHGDADQVVPIDRGRELASRIPGARLEVIPGGGHNYLVALDGKANEVVVDFWDHTSE